MRPLRPPAALLLRLRRHAASAAAAVDPTRPPWTPAAVPPPTDAAALAAAHGAAPALVAADGRVMTFTSLAATAAAAADALASILPSLAAPPDTHDGLIAGRRVLLLGEPSPRLAAAAAGVWRAGGVAVPLHARDPPLALAAAAAAVQAAAVVVGDGVAGAAVEAVARGGGVAVARVDDVVPDTAGHAAPSVPPLPPHAGALILFTSGTTGAPKPALHTHASLAAQAAALAGAWRLAPGDCVVNALPPHHIHGAVVATLAPLAGGAAVRLLPRFEAGAVWRAVADGGAPAATILMGVPTMYAKLLAHADGDAAAATAAARRLRFAACGSAPCPAPVAERWHRLAGAPLVERYGSTEAGIVLSAPLPVGGAGGVPRGCVGWPLPGVAARVVGGTERPPPAHADSAAAAAAAVTGELQLRWAGAFAGYWRNPDATQHSFEDGGGGASPLSPTASTRWFKSGDVVAAAGPTGAGPFTILGRASSDVFKVWGDQVSALAVEDALRAHPAVADAAVVGLPSDSARGADVAAAVVVAEAWRGDRAPKTLGAALAAWVAARLPAAATPTRVAVLGGDLPRNTMGKVDKKRVAADCAWVKVRRGARVV